MPSKNAQITFEDTLKRLDEGNVRWINAPDEDHSAMDTIEGRLLVPPEINARIHVRESEHEGLAAAVGWTRPVSLEVSSSVSEIADLNEFSTSNKSKCLADGHIPGNSEMDIDDEVSKSHMTFMADADNLQAGNAGNSHSYYNTGQYATARRNWRFVPRLAQNPASSRPHSHFLTFLPPFLPIYSFHSCTSHLRKTMTSSWSRGERKQTPSKPCSRPTHTMIHCIHTQTHACE
jgi:hypothetical protein